MFILKLIKTNRLIKRSFYLGLAILTSVSVIHAKPVEKMTLEEKCGVFRDVSAVYVENYFNGQSKAQQYGFVEKHVDDEQAVEFNKKLIDGIYENIPLTMDSVERKSYKQAFSTMIYDGCIKSQNPSK